MAAKSDFAQKLLQDLRLRKERMAATQNSGSSRPASRGAQGNIGISNRGSKKVTALESVGSRSGNSMRKTSSSRSSFQMEDSSNQIVLYGRGGNSERMSDLPTTLSIGFENGGKFTKIDASGSNQLLNFLHHISRRSVGTGKMEISQITGKSMGKIKTTSTGQFPTSYSHIHIHDVSKGVQKLNQILRTCSNGAGFDTYSIEVGKELLRGAMDLEESLRMLVNLQETSDYMVKSQRKSKIKLLDEDEDDQAEVVKASELKVVARPRFSFDKPKEAEQNGIKRQLMALTYPEEKQVRNSSSHSRTGNCVSNIKGISTHLEPKDNPKSQSKGRISNVIAKLMGLEEISAKQESMSTPLRELSSNKTEKMAAIGSPVNSKTATRNPMLDTGKMLKAETFSATPDGSSRVTISHGQWQNMEVAAKKYAGPGKQLDSQKYQMRENKDDKEKRSKMKTENGEMLAEEARQQSEPSRHLSSKSEDIIELKRTAIQPRITNVQSPQRIIKQQYKPGGQKGQLREVPKKSDFSEQKRKQQLQKKKKQVYESHCNQSKTSVTSNPIKSTKCLPKKNSCDALAPSAVDKKKLVKDIGPKLPKDLSMKRLLKVKENSVNLPQQVKNKISIQASKDHTCQEDAASNARSEITKAKQGTSDTESPDQPNIIMQEKSLTSSNGVEHTTAFQSEEAKVGITSLNKTEEKVESPNAEDFLHRKDEVVSHSNLGEQEEATMLDVSKTQPCNEESKDMVTAIPEPQEKQLLDQETTVPHDDVPLRSHEVLHQHRDRLNNGIHGESQELSKPEHKKKQSNGAVELLTESEKHLKEKLIKGQLFLNTAEALFKLNIPISVLDGNDHHNHEPETKLILDSAHELLKKKGQKQESSLFPGKKSTFPKIRSFDGLIKQISRDFETLKSYGGNAESDTAECLNTMLEKDFENTHSEVCCVWDFGWSEDPFGFQEHYEIAKDVEKRVLNGLLDDITKELLQVAVVSSA